MRLFVEYEHACYKTGWHALMHGCMHAPHRQPSLLGAGSGGLARGGWGAAHRTHPRQRLHTLIGVTSVNRCGPGGR